MGVNVNSNLKDALDGKVAGGPLGTKGREWKLGTLIDTMDDRVIALENEIGTSGVLTVDTIREATASAGVDVESRLTTTDGVASGTARTVGGVAYSDPSASTAVLGTVEVITNFDNTYTLPAGSLKVGTKVRMRAVGHHTATTSAETLVFTVRAGTTALAVTGNIDPAANDMWEIVFEFDVRVASATGQVVGMGVARSGTRGGTTFVQHFLGTGSAADSHTVLDTTLEQVLAIAVTHQTSATDANSVRMDAFTVEVIG